MLYNLPLVFDSNRLAPAQRFDFTREEFGRRVLQVELDRVSERPFRVRLSGDIFGAARIVTVTSSPLRQARGREIVAGSDGCIGFLIPLRGRYVAGHKGAQHSLTPGQMMALSNNIEGVVSCPAGGSFLTIITPEENLRNVLNGHTPRFGEHLHGDPQSLALLHAYLRFIGCRNGGLSDPGRALIGRHVLELLGLCLESNNEKLSEASEDSLMAARSAAVHAEVDQHFSKAWFGIESCAAKLGISPRYVQFLFQKDGTSFVEEVKRRRLAMAHRILMDPANRNARITDIAIDCGYSDISHFNRQFREAFGDSPSGVRNSKTSG